jgi:3-dehydroquinate dehydratase-2
MKILVINGPNLNMVGIREPDLYGKQDFRALERYVKDSAAALGVKVKLFQSNSEGDIVTAIQRALGRYQGIVINAGAYTHTSVAILDALKAVALPTVEVHLTDIAAREPFRQHSYVSLYAQLLVKGKGFEGYREALEYLVNSK